LPHTVEIEHTRTNWIHDKSQMDYGYRPGFPQEKKQLATGFFQTKIHANETERIVGLGRIQIDTDNLGMRQHWQQPHSQVSGNSCYDDPWFFIAHYYYYLGPGAGGFELGPPVGGGKGIPCVGGISGPK
jgi:hypothetical protein